MQTVHSAIFMCYDGMNERLQRFTYSSCYGFQCLLKDYIPEQFLSVFVPYPFVDENSVR